MPPIPVTDDEPRPALADRRVVQVLEEPELVVAADERRLERVRPATAATLGDDSQRPEGGDGRGLALERLLAGGLERDRRACRALRRLAHQHRPGRRHRLEARGRVDDVAGDHALVGRAQGHRRLAGEHARARLDPGSEDPDSVHQLEGGPDAPLGVVLARGRRPPDGHHRVADELLDEAAVPGDDLGRDVEVPGQGLADLLAVALLGEGREADEVREQHRDQAALGDGGRRRVLGAPDGPSAGRRERRGSRGRRCRTRARDERRPALPAELLARLVRHATGRARRREGGPALRTELASGSVLGPAAGAGQRIPSYAGSSGQPRVADCDRAHRISRMQMVRLYRQHACPRRPGLLRLRRFARLLGLVAARPCRCPSPCRRRGRPSARTRRPAGRPNRCGPRSTRSSSRTGP